MKVFCQRIVGATWFEPVMIGLILFNAVLIGLETSRDRRRVKTPLATTSSWAPSSSRRR
jgi:hypothetical protein